MDEKIIPINVKMYFEGVFYFSGWTMIVISLPILAAFWWVALIVGFVGMVIVTTQYKLDVDPSKKIVIDYLWFLGLKTNRENFKYSNLHYILIKKTDYVQQMNHQSISARVKGTKYIGYLICDEQKHYLGESENFSQLKSRLESIAFKLKTEINYPSA